MPQASGRVLFVPLAIRETDKFQLHTPGRQKVDPGLSGAWAGRAHRWFAEYSDAFLLQVTECGVKIIDVHSQVMSTDVAVLRLPGVLVRRVILEDFEIRTILASQEPQFFHHCARMYIQMRLHPVIVELKRPEFVEFLATDNIYEKVDCFVQIGHREADVICSP